MKIHTIHLKGVGPFSERTHSLNDEWKGGLHEMILLSGSNGCGKSTLLRAVAHLWNMAGSWLTNPQGKPDRSNSSYKWLKRWRTAAVILDDVPEVGRLGLFFGQAVDFDLLQEQFTDVCWMGETHGYKSSGESVFREMIHGPGNGVSKLSELYKSLLLTGKSPLPNVIHLDGEERRWVNQTKIISEVLPDDEKLRWLTSYRPTEQGPGQMEASLIALKTIDPDSYYQTIRDLNAFLKPKAIDPEPHPVSLRLKVMPADGDLARVHQLDDLSAGEHQILIQLYLVSRWLRHGGIVMIDEPDLHLHPSLLSLFHSRLEKLVRERQGQLLLTSHNPELWRRYENKGLRIKMGEEQP